jgi:hypothetical protein
MQCSKAEQSISKLADHQESVDAVMSAALRRTEDSVLFLMTKKGYESAKGMMRKSAVCGIDKPCHLTGIGSHKVGNHGEAEVKHSRQDHDCFDHAVVERNTDNVPLFSERSMRFFHGNSSIALLISAKALCLQQRQNSTREVRM